MSKDVHYEFWLLLIPYYCNQKQKNPNAGFVLDMDCPHCSKPFVIEWDIDPRKNLYSNL